MIAQPNFVFTPKRHGRVRVIPVNQYGPNPQGSKPIQRDRIRQYPPFALRQGNPSASLFFSGSPRRPIRLAGEIGLVSGIYTREVCTLSPARNHVPTHTIQNNDLTSYGPPSTTLTLNV